MSRPMGGAADGRPVLLGAATSRFGKLPERTLEQLAWEAIDQALERAGIEASDVGEVFVGNVFGPSGVAARVVRAAGIAGVPVTRVEAACASGTLAAHLAAEAVGAGRDRFTLALGIEQMSTIFGGAIVPEDSDSEGSLGLPMPGLYALAASRYLYLHDVTVADLASVAVKNRANGVRNPNAHRQSAVTLEEVLASRMIADPLTVLQCCPVSDGAAAAVYGATPVGPGAVVVETSGTAGGRAWPAPDDELWGVACIRRAADAAREHADAPLDEVDILEVHDAFTIGELVTLEALDVCAPGEAVKLLRDGELHPTGRWPVNVGGGLLSRGHALGATGLAQITEVYEQLTGRAGPRQLGTARRGLVETMGGGAAGLDGNAAVVQVLRAL